MHKSGTSDKETRPGSCVEESCSWKHRWSQEAMPGTQEEAWSTAHSVSVLEADTSANISGFYEAEMVLIRQS